jgi:hypothetical protein
MWRVARPIASTAATVAFGEAADMSPLDQRALAA